MSKVVDILADVKNVLSAEVINLEPVFVVTADFKGEMSLKAFSIIRDLLTRSGLVVIKTEIMRDLKKSVELDLALTAISRARATMETSFPFGELELDKEAESQYVDFQIWLSEKHVAFRAWYDLKAGKFDPKNYPRE